VKLKTKIIAGGVVFVLWAMAAANLQAQVTFTNLITITATAEFQGNYIRHGVIETADPPVSAALGTKQILSYMAMDENAAGGYGRTSFPSGAKLVEIDSTNPVDYQVLDKSDNFLADVTNVFGIGHPTNQIFIGKYDESTGLNEPTVTAKYIVRYVYNDWSISGGADLYFNLQGLTTRTITDTVTNKDGVFTETKLSDTPSAEGQGNCQGKAFVFTGSITQTRSNKFILTSQTD
jgi:hypothetical protein